MNSNKKEAIRAVTAASLVSIFILAFAITPLVMASTQSANDQIEIIRAQTQYKPATGLVVDPPALSAFSASLSPDMILVRDAASVGGAQGALLLQAAGDS